MTTQENVTKGRVRIFSCGGAGVNIGQHFEQHRGASESAFAEIDVVYVDTSRSNLRTTINPDHCYMLDGMDGSGKVRSENHQEIDGRIRAILQKFKPVGLNIVLSSASGGSGSVIGPLLTSELLGSESPTIVIAIGSADSRLDAENTLKTIKSYESIARMRKAPVVMSYVQNSKTNSRSEADASVIAMVMALCVLFSRENRELDSRDLFNFLRFDRVTTFPAQLAALTLVEGKAEIKDLGNVISVATLAKEGGVTTLKETPDYQCVGYFPETADESILQKAPMHFVTSDGIFPEVAIHLQKILRDLESVQSARVKRQGFLSNTDSATESGLVL